MYKKTKIMTRVERVDSLLKLVKEPTCESKPMPHDRWAYVGQEME